MIASASADDYQRAIEALAADPSVDAVVAIFIPPLVTQAHGRRRRGACRLGRDSGGRQAAARGLDGAGRRRARDARGRRRRRAGLRHPGGGRPRARARRRLRRAGGAPAAEPAELPDGIDVDAAAATVAEVLAEGGGWLVPDRVAELLSAYGVPQVAATVVATPAAVGRRAAELGGAVAIKAIAPGLLHKSDAGAVRLGIRGARRRRPRGARDRRRRARGRPPAGRLPRAGDGARGRRDARRRRVGPGLGPGRGVRRRRHAPSSCSATCSRASRRSAATTPQRCSARCAPSRCSTATAARRRADVAALEDILVRIAALAAAHPEIAELDCNPVLVGDRRRDRRRRAHPDRRTAARAAVPVARPLTRLAERAHLARHLEVLAGAHDDRAGRAPGRPMSASPSPPRCCARRARRRGRTARRPQPRGPRRRARRRRR